MINYTNLLQRYKKNPAIRGLIQLLPYGSIVDLVLIETLANMKEKRTRLFFDELAKGDVVLDEMLLESEDFVHHFIVTARLALNSRRREKIQMFARLLKSSLNVPSLTESDQYEDFLKILDELSYREIQALNLLDHYSSAPRDEVIGDDLLWINTYWEAFENDLCEQLKIPQDEVVHFMNRIARTGCYEIIVGSYIGYAGGRGKLTPNYRRLKEYILDSQTQSGFQASD